MAGEPVSTSPDSDVRDTPARGTPSLGGVVLAELARLRRGFVTWYALLIPLLLAVPLYVANSYTVQARMGYLWEGFRDTTMELWGVSIPMSAALLAGLSIRADHSAWRFFLAYPLPRYRLFVGKFAALAVLSLVSSTVLALALVVGAALNRHFPLGSILAMSYLPWVAGLGVLALGLLIAFAGGLGASLTVGILGMFSGALIADKTIWPLLPFGWPMRAILPLAGIHSNGIALDFGDPLRSTGVLLPASLLSVALAVVALLAGSALITRKEI